MGFKPDLESIGFSHQNKKARLLVSLGTKLYFFIGYLSEKAKGWIHCTVRGKDATLLEPPGQWFECSCWVCKVHMEGMVDSSMYVGTVYIECTSHETTLCECMCIENGLCKVHCLQGFI